MSDVLDYMEAKQRLVKKRRCKHKWIEITHPYLWCCKCGVLKEWEPRGIKCNWTYHYPNGKVKRRYKVWNKWA